MEPATAIRRSAIPLTGRAGDYDTLLERIADKRFVLIGEASHGTHEFYAIRAAITRRLMEEKGFGAVVVEGDWPDAYRVNRWVCHESDDADASEALGGFRRFPRWMWRNTVVGEFVRWLRGRRRGFFGMDLYSLNASREAVIRFLEQTDLRAASRARERYGCFDHFGDAEEYGYSSGESDNCREEAIRQLLEIQELAAQHGDGEGFFSAEQNARLVRNAEEYYRSMFGGRVASWNLRDRHMADTITGVASRLNTRVAVWAHNSHLGDARATEVSRWGEWNVGQLMRERFPGETFSVGFTTYSGTVMAADDWGREGRVKTVRQGMPGSWEELMHTVRIPAFLAWSDDLPDLNRIERAIGVIYRPETERASHYFEARLREQFDAVIHVDETHAVEPLDRHVTRDRHEVPETFPAGV